LDKCTDNKWDKGWLRGARGGLSVALARWMDPSWTIRATGHCLSSWQWKLTYAVCFHTKVYTQMQCTKESLSFLF
jgi:hypothetical protein